MKASIDALESLFDSRGIGDISADELDLVREILLLSTRKVIEYTHCVLLLEQRIYEVRPHESGTAGHEYASHPKSSKELRRKDGS
jgi:hypothetical protein